MNAELPPFKNKEHNSESASTTDRVITPLIKSIAADADDSYHLMSFYSEFHPKLRRWFDCQTVL